MPPTPPQKVVQVERQNERGLAYGALAVLLGGAGLAMLAVPQRCVEFLWAATPSALVAGITRNFGSMLLLAAICAHCLKVICMEGLPGCCSSNRGGMAACPRVQLPAALGITAGRCCMHAVPRMWQIAWLLRHDQPAVLCPLPPCATSLPQEAAEHGRMQSDTYLRLNLGLLWWGLGSALALWLAPAQPLRMGQG